MKCPALLCLLLLVACASSSKQGPPNQVQASESQPAPSAVTPGPLDRPAQPLVHVLLPPAPGTSRSVYEGCVGEAASSESRSAPVAPGDEKDGVAVTGIIGGLLVSHELTHGCCLKAEVTTEIVGASVVVKETLSGTPCRCMCRSTLKTAVGLAAGEYDVAVHLDGRARPEVVFQGRTQVR